jgi:hypothetical protein
MVWPQETAQVEPSSGDRLGETPEGVSPRPGDRGHDTRAAARTQHSPTEALTHANPARAES